MSFAPKTRKPISPLAAAAASAFLPGAGQSRQGRKGMAAIMYLLILGLLGLWVYDICTTYITAFNLEIERMAALGLLDVDAVFPAVRHAVVACIQNTRIITVLIVLPFVHLWSLVDAYRWGKRAADSPGLESGKEPNHD